MMSKAFMSAMVFVLKNKSAWQDLPFSEHDGIREIARPPLLLFYYSIQMSYCKDNICQV
jgi:hypothetical protein